MTIGINKLMRIFISIARSFCNAHYIVFAEHLAVHLLKIVMQVRANGIILYKIIFKPCGESREAGIFCNELKGIKPETIYSFIEPEFHYIKHLFAHLWVFPVEVGLLS